MMVGLRARMVVAVCTIGMVAACSGDDDTTTSADTGEADAAVQDEVSDADKAIVQAALFRLEDFPAGWGKTAPDEDAPTEEEEEESQRRIAECVGVDYEVLYETGYDEDSPDFESPDGSELSNSAAIAPDLDTATFGFETIANDDAIGCISEEMQRTIDEGIPDAEDAEFGDVTINQISFPSLGDDSAAYRISLPVEAEGFSIEVHVDTVLIRVGRVNATVQALSVFDPYDPAELEDWAQLTVDRLTEAGAGA